MPPHKVKCPICLEPVFSNWLGAHMLSKSHYSDIRTPKNLAHLSSYLSYMKGEANHGFVSGRGSPPVFKIKDNSYGICLHCDKIYDTDASITHIQQHYKDHPTCKDTLKDDLEKFINAKKPKEKAGTSNNEVEALKETIRKLREEIELNEETIDDLQNDYDKQRSFIKDAFGRCEIDDMIYCLEDKKANGFTFFDL